MKCSDTFGVMTCWIGFFSDGCRGESKSFGRKQVEDAETKVTRVGKIVDTLKQRTLLPWHTHCNLDNTTHCDW